ncbi:IS66 family transposase zinc-finger binding domain-containing protein [Klebsiella michiganensis]|uniref:IS66 family transposase zinc-finger binding domain-containing protein n=2 Tax=Klebsiella/Raoultella group TaxID=2890311 RepID=UPI001D0E3B53|nr:IS66 family transposase zinc-finger binding domain-containing protein [Klebsiella michiganensis]MDM4112005.1 IS66 family transposase zinc-finger binding domain-containing protein [Klebsiella michiganensis]MDM4343958.1 IS66 family transposase zinc-finger binding domain-containing protein [Klebsiella michiganensis]
MHGRCSIYKTPFTSFDEVTLYNDSEIISWLECGKPLQFLPSHIGFVPGQSAYAYRDKWNIPRSMPLAGTDCSQPLHHIPDEISGRLDDIPAQFVVKRYVRPQYGCDGCQRVVSGRLPAQIIPKSIPEAGLVAQVLVSKYCDRQSLYHQQRQRDAEPASVVIASSPERYVHPTYCDPVASGCVDGRNGVAGGGEF